MGYSAQIGAGIPRAGAPIGSKYESGIIAVREYFILVRLAMNFCLLISQCTKSSDFVHSSLNDYFEFWTGSCAFKNYLSEMPLWKAYYQKWYEICIQNTWYGIGLPETPTTRVCRHGGEHDASPHNPGFVFSCRNYTRFSINNAKVYLKQ